MMGYIPTGLFGTAVVAHPNDPVKTELVSPLTKPPKFTENAGLFAPYGRVPLFDTIVKGACATLNVPDPADAKRSPWAAKLAETE